MDNNSVHTTLVSGRPQIEPQLVIPAPAGLRRCAAHCLLNHYNFAVWSSGNKTCNLYVGYNLQLITDPQVTGIDLSPSYKFQ